MVGGWHDAKDGELQGLFQDWREKFCNVARPRVVVCAYYVNPNNAHVKNEKMY